MAGQVLMIRPAIASIAIWAALLAGAYAFGLKIAPRPGLHAEISGCATAPTFPRSRTL